MSSALDRAHEKWFRKTTGNKDLWVKMVSRAESKDAYISGIARVTGLSEGAVRSSMPVKEFSKFQSNPRRFVDKFISGIKRAYEAGKWKTKYKEAFRG